MPIRLLAAAMAAVLLLAACAGDDDDDDGAAAAADAATPTQEATAEESPEAADEPTATEEPPPPAQATPEPEEDDASEDGDPVATQEPEEIPEDPAFTELSKLSTVGLDELDFGMNINDAAEAVGAAWAGVPQAPLPECYVITPANGPEGVAFTVTAGTIERVDITTDLITTRSGAGVGSDVQALENLFGNQLEESGTDVVFVPTDEGDRAFRIIFETDGIEVTAVRAGRVGVVEPAEPCA